MKINRVKSTTLAGRRAECRVLLTFMSVGITAKKMFAISFIIWHKNVKLLQNKSDEEYPVLTQSSVHNLQMLYNNATDIHI